MRSGNESIAEAWLVAAMKRNLPTKISTDLSMELRKLHTVDAIRHIINIYRHDHRTGLPRGVPGTMLAMTESVLEEAAQNDNSKTENIKDNSDQHGPDCPNELYTVQKGGKVKDKQY